MARLGRSYPAVPLIRKQRIVAAGGGAVTVSVTDANWFFSPYNWQASGSAFKQATSPAAYMKAVVGNTTSIKLNVDVAPLVAASVSAANYPAIIYSVDQAAWTRYQLTSADTQLTLGTGLSNASHTVDVIFVGMFWNSNDLWNNPDLMLRITGMEIDNGASTSAPTLYSGRMLVYGDSLSIGYEVLAAGVSVANQDAAYAFPLLMARAFSCEVGVVGYAGQGYDTAVATANVPALSSAWNLYMSGQSRLSGGLFSPAPDYIVSAHGTNDGGSVASTVTSLIGSWRTAAPLAKMFLCVPPGLAQEANISTGVANAGDANAFFIDHTENMLIAQTKNGTHLNLRGQPRYAAADIKLMQGKLTGGTASLFTHPGMTGRMAA